MPAAPLRAPEPPAWEVLLSHHTAHRLGRTWTLPRRAGPIHVCTRCTGQLLGALALVVGATAVPAVGPALYAPVAQLVVAVLPVAAAADWTTQSLGRRESSTGLRLLSGGLLGFAFADLLGLLLVRPWWWFALGVGIASVYVAGIAGALWASGRWRGVVEDHFPGALAPGPPP